MVHFVHVEHPTPDSTGHLPDCLSILQDLFFPLLILIPLAASLTVSCLCADLSLLFTVAGNASSSMEMASAYVLFGLENLLPTHRATERLRYLSPNHLSVLLLTQSFSPQVPQTPIESCIACHHPWISHYSSAQPPAGSIAFSFVKGICPGSRCGGFFVVSLASGTCNESS